MRLKGCSRTVDFNPRDASFSDVDALIALFEDLADTELSLPDEGIDGYEVRLMMDGKVIGE